MFVFLSLQKYGIFELGFGTFFIIYWGIKKRNYISSGRQTE